MATKKSKTSTVMEVTEEAKVSKPLQEFVDVIWDAHKQLKDVNLNRYGFGAWSISKLKVLQKCPFQFYLKYVLKVKPPALFSANQDTLLADVGSAAHRALELLMLGKTTTIAFETTKKEFVPSKLSEEQWKENVESLENQCVEFKERMDRFSRTNPIKRVFTEMRMGVTKKWEGCAFFDKDAYFRGIIDLALQLENDDLIIIDHKTGGGEGSIRPYEAQLDSYKPLFHHGMSPVKGAQAGIHFIRAKEVKMGRYSPKEDIQGKLITDLEWAMDGAVDNVKELGFFKHICGNQCKWCEFAPVCKSDEKLLKSLELDTKRLIP